jgi:hypothetical protein
MKKTTEKKLSLGKIKIASLSKHNQHMIKGGSTVPACNTQHQTLATNAIRCVVYSACQCPPPVYKA